MRKADYAALAEIIKREMAEASEAKNRCAPHSVMGHVLRGRFLGAEAIAVHFADRASVDRAEFLKACGIG